MSDQHHGHEAHSISEPCIPQCPHYEEADQLRERLRRYEANARLNIADLRAEVEQLREDLADWQAMHAAELERYGNAMIEVERLRGAVPPPGWIITRQEDIDRLHNESEARRIERDYARAEVEPLREALTKIANYDTHRDIPGPSLIARAALDKGRYDS